MKKKVLIWVLAAVLVLSMAGCAAGAVSSNDKYVGMEPTAAAEAAAAETKDTTSISDLIRVPFGYLLDRLYTAPAPDFATGRRLHYLLLAQLGHARAEKME